MENKINNEIASKLNKKPNREIDQLIINKANLILVEETNLFTLGLSFTSFAMLLFLIINVGKIPIEPSMPKGSEEMVAYYQEMEVMASMGELNDHDLEMLLKD